MTRRRKTDGERIAERLRANGCVHNYYVPDVATAIDRIILRRMAEAWEEGRCPRDSKYWNGGEPENPYAGRRKK